jgi:hypothetical protein
MHRHIQKNSTTSQQKFQVGRISVAAEGTKKFDPAKLARLDLLFGARIAGIEATHKPQLDRDSSLSDDIDDARRLGRSSAIGFSLKTALPA